MREVWPRGGLRAGVLALLAGAAAPAVPASAQKTVQEMAAECAAAQSQIMPLCLEGVLALQAARGGIGLAASQGTPVPGSTSTLGRRLGSTPRVALSLRGGLTRVGMPDPRAGDAPADERTFWAPAIEGAVTVGMTDGVSLLPTVGGVFSLDLLGSLTVMGLSDGAGFRGSVQGVGYGARLGLLRESFTLPGVSVSVTRRRLGDVEWGEAGTDRARGVVRTTVTSVRAAAGKDFLAFGIIGGWGWERYGGSTTLTVTQAAPSLTGEARSGDFTSDRRLFFGGLSYTFLVLQLAAEGGFATGWEEVPERSDGGYDPTAGSIFGSLSGRLTL